MSINRPTVRAAFALLCGAMVAASPAMAWDHLPVLAYARFGPEGGRAIRIDQFEAHLAEIARGGWSVLPLSEALAALRARRPLPQRSLAITIDGTHESVFLEAWPRLKRAGLPATVFVTTNTLDHALPGYMSWGQLREMAAGGMEIGSLTAAHPHLTDQTQARVAEELSQARRRIEAEIGRPPAFFAYPYGEWSAEVRSAVIASGHIAAFGQQSGVVHAGSDWWALPRFPMNEAQGGMTRFQVAINALPLPVTGLTPADPALTDPRPAIGFTVDPAVGPLDRLACFASGEAGPLDLGIEGRRVTVRLGRELTVGRTRINCTAPGPAGTWRWLGLQLHLAKGGQ
jgi:peptidoglycan/xylan/chitin deacetylase (PgdA/CDA1 family)